ncbi:MAG: CCA tRNA nucleotidyltransferase [Candidatus Gracilibacteria bacterium]|jgi:poly(A) polymerase
MQNTAKQIVATLQKAGFKAYLAGGCVRDMLMKREPKDYDIATSALPEQIENIFTDTYAVGKSFGVMHVIENGFTFEIATFRSDSGYSDGRRPDAVIFTHAQDDACRRDFTINALFYDPIADEIHDFVGGRDDISNKLIRFIGVPHERILEDHLRIIRAIRFKNTLNFGYHPDTYAAIKKHAPLADKVSWERVRDELNKIIMARSAPTAFEDMQDTGVLPYVLPELEACKGMPQPMEYHTEGDVWTHLMDSLKSLPESADLVDHWAVIFHDIGKTETFKIAERIRFDHHSEVSAELAERIMRRLRFPRKDIDTITWVVAHHFMMQQLLDMPEGRKRHWFLDPRFPHLLTLFYADAAGITPQDFNLCDKVKAEYEKFLVHFPVPPKPFLTGEDIMQILHLPAGPRIGEILSEAMEKQLCHEFKTREEAVEWLDKLNP